MVERRTMAEITAPGARTYYLDPFSDEVVPCDCTLEGWAAWLAEPHADGWSELGELPAGDGQTFTGHALLWRPDIVAACRDGAWTLSRPFAEDELFAAVRFGPGMGWDAESIVDATAGDVRQLLADWTADDGEAYVAVGVYEPGWRFTFHEGEPPRLEAERLQ